ncbi:SDR family oxidoreductase [Epibacterium sp. SM1979]|uniref:SDR family oxidoreductase n=1 Tax=Tritonibacter litoralis TaxID=2662264 RepID=A0A843YN30_9RHOB|nr:SDR family oxidoreductase [Tritonibacter litoralis]MQQ10649.1 SDR family oxidoreductase [Tritonibacter litoralis]
MQLKDKTVIITGASSGIGAAAALMFAKEGAKLVLGARREKELSALVGQINQSNGNATCLAGDVSDEDYNKALVELAENTYGNLDAAFNNAGIMGDQIPVPDMDAANWDAVMKTNLTSAFYASKHQIPAMKRNGGGSVIFTSSFVGHTAGFPGMGAYGASKAGLVGLTQVLATEHGADGIRANALLPGATETPMTSGALEAPEQKAFFESLHALKRVAEPNEIAQAAMFLASDASTFVTGTAMIVDGGNSINKV